MPNTTITATEVAIVAIVPFAQVVGTAISVVLHPDEVAIDAVIPGPGVDQKIFPVVVDIVVVIPIVPFAAPVTMDFSFGALTIATTAVVTHYAVVRFNFGGLDIQVTAAGVTFYQSNVDLSVEHPTCTITVEVPASVSLMAERSFVSVGV